MMFYMLMWYCAGACSSNPVTLANVYESRSRCEDAELYVGYEKTSDGTVMDGPVPGSKYLMNAHEVNPRVLYGRCFGFVVTTAGVTDGKR